MCIESFTRRGRACLKKPPRKEETEVKRKREGEEGKEEGRVGEKEIQGQVGRRERVMRPTTPKPFF